MAVSRVRAVSVPWDSQPPDGTPLSQEDPITKGLIGFLWMGSGQPKDLVSGLFASVMNAPPVPSASGVARVAPAATGNGVYYDRQANPNWFTPGAVTFMAYENHGTANATAPFAAAGHGVSGYHLGDWFGGTRTRRVVVTTSGGAVAASDVATWSTKETVRGLTWDGATLSGYEGDKVFATATGSGTITYDAFVRVFWSSNPDGGGAVGGTGYWMAAWNRVLSAAEIKRLNDAPWCMFEPQQILAPVPSLTVSAWWAGDEASMGSWTASNGGTLASCISETTFSDLEWIEGPVGSNTPNFPWLPSALPAGNYDFPVRAERMNATGQIRTVFLDAGGAVLATGAWHALTGSYVEYTDNLTIASTSTHFRLETQA